jgi:OHCU decarboxylase
MSAAGGRLTMEEVNALDREAFLERFGPVFEYSPWVAEEAWRGRPFDGRADLAAAFHEALLNAPEERQVLLIRAHPELAGRAAEEGALTADSAREQSSAGLDRLTPDELEAFARINRDYRERFELPFVVCVREHTKDSILATAEERLRNSRAEEVRTALGEIAKIGALRLEDLVEEGRR